MTGINKLKEIDIKRANKKIADKKSYRGIFIYEIGYKASNDVKILHIIFNKIDKYIENNKRSK